MEPGVTVSISAHGSSPGKLSPTAGLLLATALIIAFLWVERRHRRKALLHTAGHVQQQQQHVQRQQGPSSKNTSPSSNTAAPTCSCSAGAIVRVLSLSGEARDPLATSPFALARAPAFSSLDEAPTQEQQQGRQQDGLAGGPGAAGASLQRYSPPHLSTVLHLPLLLQQGNEQAQVQSQQEQPEHTAADSSSLHDSPTRCTWAPATEAAPPHSGTQSGLATKFAASAAARTSPAQAGRSDRATATLGAPKRASADRATLDELRSELSLSGQPMEQLLSGLGFPPLQPGPQLPQPVPLQAGLRERSPHRGSQDGPALSDWEVSPNELEVCRRPDGSLWQLGAGGYGRVYKAMRFGVQPVAVKVLAPTSDSRPGELEEIRREAELLKACKDPNIVAFLGASLSAEFTLLVLELCEGGALSANLAAGRVSWYRRGKQVALDVARGLAYLHGRRLIHLDLKSGNILLDRHGHAKVSDLGLARIAAHESAVTATVGTLDWAAPEVLLGLRCTEKADIYSFGVCLWEIATQARPIRGRMRPLECPQDCPPEVAALVAACMDPDPSQRPSAQQLVERLLAAPAEAPPGTTASKAARAARPLHSASAEVLRASPPAQPMSPRCEPQHVCSSAPAPRPLEWEQPCRQVHALAGQRGRSASQLEGPAAHAASAGPAMAGDGQAPPAGAAQGMARAASSPADMAHPPVMLADVYGIGMF